MQQININEDILLLLTNEKGIVQINHMDIDNHFERESENLFKLCQGSHDNLEEIALYITNFIKPKLPTKTFKYCKELDKAYQSVSINVDLIIEKIRNPRKIISGGEQNQKGNHSDIQQKTKFIQIKKTLITQLELWFKVFNIEFAYEKAKKIPNTLAYSHRISGWSNPDYKITENLKQQVLTNFGYGTASYFYSLLTFKNIQITPLSEWIDYRYSKFSDLIRYTKSFGKETIRTDKDGNILGTKKNIKNKHWKDAMLFTASAANLSLTNENEFIERFIISECEKMVTGLNNFANNTNFEFIRQDKESSKFEKTKKHRVDYNGYELIDFRTEKIIGALDFIKKISEYNQATPTAKYTKRIIAINEKFIPEIHPVIKSQEKELENSQYKLSQTQVTYNKKLEKKHFYDQEKIRLKGNFETEYGTEYSSFNQTMMETYETLKRLKQKINLHTNNVKKLKSFLLKHKVHMQEQNNL